MHAVINSRVVGGSAAATACMAHVIMEAGPTLYEPALGIPKKMDLHDVTSLLVAGRTTGSSNASSPAVNEKCKSQAH